MNKTEQGSMTMLTVTHNRYIPTINDLDTKLTRSCLFGIVVEYVTIRLSMQPGLISCIKPSTNPEWGAKLGQARML